MSKLLSNFIKYYPGPYCFCPVDGDETSYQFFCQSNRSYLFTIQNDSEDFGAFRLQAFAAALLLCLDAVTNTHQKEAL